MNSFEPPNNNFEENKQTFKDPVFWIFNQYASIGCFIVCLSCAFEFSNLHILIVKLYIAFELSNLLVHLNCLTLLCIWIVQLTCADAEERSLSASRGSRWACASVARSLPDGSTTRERGTSGRGTSKCSSRNPSSTWSTSRRSWGLASGFCCLQWKKESK